MSNPLSNSDKIQTDGVDLWDPSSTSYVPILDLVSSNIVGLAPSTLNSIEKLSAAIGDDPSYFETVAGGIDDRALKSDVAIAFANQDVGQALSQNALKLQLEAAIDLRETKATVASLLSGVNSATTANATAISAETTARIAADVANTAAIGGLVTTAVFNAEIAARDVEIAAKASQAGVSSAFTSVDGSIASLTTNLVNETAARIAALRTLDWR